VAREVLVGRLGVAVAVVCATALTVTAVAVAMPSVRASLGFAPPPPAPSYVAGQQADFPATLYQQSPHTLAIFFRSDCGACARMKPFLARLAARDDEATVRVVAVTGAGNGADALVFAKQIGLGESHLVTMDLKGLRLSRVPTVVLMDRSGVIQTALEGIPTSQEEEKLLRTVTSLSRSH
jgi:thiol-disulfide isomerase/thioredoxin